MTAKKRKSTGREEGRKENVEHVGFRAAFFLPPMNVLVITRVVRLHQPSCVFIIYLLIVFFLFFLCRPTSHKNIGR